MFFMRFTVMTTSSMFTCQEQKIAIANAGINFQAVPLSSGDTSTKKQITPSPTAETPQNTGGNKGVVVGE